MALSPSSPHGSSSAQHELLDALSALHHGGKYSDLKVVCNDREWNVHKAIVCSRSGFFDGACSHQFREAKAGVIDLSEDDEDAVEQMIQYMYHLDYLNEQLDREASAMFRHRAYSDARRKLPPKIDFTKIEDPLLSQAGFYDSQASTSPCSSPPRGNHSSPEKLQSSPMAARSDTPSLETDQGSDGEEDCEMTESESHLILHTQVYAIAEKYDIPTLKALAKKKFEVAVACYYDAPELAEAIELVYSNTVDSDRGLREVVLQLFKFHPQLANMQDIFAVIKETPTLALDLWKVERGLL